MHQLYSWTDAYLALADAFGTARGWLDDIEGGEHLRRCPATTNADVIMLGAIFDDAIRKARGVCGRAAMWSKWEVCSSNIERSALPPADPKMLYHHNKTLWSCFKEACLFLEHDGYPVISRATWAAIRAQIADPIDHGLERNRWRNDYRKDIKISETSDGKVTFENWKAYDDLYLAQWDYFRTKRGFDQPGGAKGDVIPRTTNADALQLATLWTNALADNEGLGDRPGMKEWDTPVDAWKQAAAHVAVDAVGHDRRATYPHNEELWRAMDDLSSILTVGKLAPTKAELFVAAAEKAIVDLPQNVYKGVKAIAGGAEDAIEGAAHSAGKAGGALVGGLLGGLSPFKWPLVIGGGVLGVYLVTRNRDTTRAKEGA